MEKETNIIEVPRKRGRPPGSKKIFTDKNKPKRKRGRPPSKAGLNSGGRISPKIKSTTIDKAKRYSAQEKRMAIDFIKSHGRGGMSLAVKEFGISYPTLAKWMKEAGNGKAFSITQKARRKPGRPPKGKAKPSGHIFISKKVFKEFQKVVANLEVAFGAFSNALRVLE